MIGIEGTANGTANGPAAKGPKFRPFRLPCPHCGHLDGDGHSGLRLDLADGKVGCPECDKAVTKADLDDLIAEARRLARLLDLIPTL